MGGGDDDGDAGVGGGEGGEPCVGASYVPCCRAWIRGLHGCSGHNELAACARCTRSCRTWLERVIDERPPC